ncbi:RNA recognition motif containing protein [Nitzschia inconspicua]|uniref:RNA recognition motif containing protein n=1 Tax=Nitzschia inconspicua TaxID=303405 RepID=A0A9K3KYB1_9STRA|nr:RNA recognition motif containing protein [Nitzschia inconspicua]KAG7352133.1 RNA recognition motif containing protein [Nitzschia inconspicua]
MAPSRAKGEEDAKPSRTEEEETDLSEPAKNDEPSSSKKKSKKSKKKRKSKRKDDKEDRGSNIHVPTIQEEKKTKRRKLNETNESAAIDTEHTIRAGAPESEDDNDDNDDDDDDLLAAAAMWAGDSSTESVGSKQAHEKSSRAKKANSPTSKETEQSTSTHDDEPLSESLSLHITQLPFDLIEMDLRKFFAEQGCSVTSIRLVYDRDVRGNKTVFRGVAFVDMLDEASYDRALKLNHKASIRGRKLNIRPTRSKQELASIVSRTKELVQERIRQQLSGDTKTTAATDSVTSKSKKKKDVNKEKSKEKPHKKETTAKVNDRNKEKAERVDANGKPIKMTKKERNRRAAIIMGLKNKKRGAAK